MAWHTEFDRAWSLVKAPILEPQPGIKMGYGGMTPDAYFGIPTREASLEPVDVPQQALDDMIDASVYPDEFQDTGFVQHEGYKSPSKSKSIGPLPYASDSSDAIRYMTPDEYFDIVYASYVPTSPNMAGGIVSSSDPGRGEGDRWKSFFDPRDETHEEAHDRQLRHIIQGIEEGKPMGMPELWMNRVSTDPEDYEYDDMQEGGHRMDALRRLGFADTPMPVFQHRRISPRLKEELRRAKQNASV